MAEDAEERAFFFAAAVAGEGDGERERARAAGEAEGGGADEDELEEFARRCARLAALAARLAPVSAR